MKIPRLIHGKNHLFLLAPGILLVLLFLMIPMFSTLATSFYKFDSSKIYIQEFTLHNYARFLFDSFYLRILLNSFKIGVMSTLLCLILGYPVAYFLARTKSNKKGLYLFLVIMPLMVGVVVRTYGWIILLGSEGIVNKFLLGIGIIDSPVRILYTEGAVIIGIVEILLPFMVLPLMSSIQKIDISQEEAARVLGATRITTFYKVILPLSVPGMISGSLLVLTLSISALSTPLFLGGPKNIMIAVLIWQQMLTVRNWPFGSTMAIILMVVTSAIIMFYLKAVRGKTTRG